MTVSKNLCVFVFTFLLSTQICVAQKEKLPKPFGYIQEEILTIALEIRYYGPHNFIGKPIEGYQKPKAILTSVAIERLKEVQKELKTLGFGLKIFDAYRPQRAVNHFVRWAKNEKDTLMKKEFYPDVAKRDLFKLDYIASKSGHSRGSTVDLTLISLETGEELDMGSPYDFFGKVSWPFDTSISKKQQENRMLLRNVMLSHHFKPYKCEWWHFTLKEEPFPDTYFDFVVK